MSQSLKGRRFVIGYALTPQKVITFMKDSLVIYAKERGVDLIPIDVNKPLIEQGPFDCIIHKLYDSEWRKQLEEFSRHLQSSNRTTLVIDPIDAIETLLNRVSMLNVVNHLKIDNLGTPLQAFLSDYSKSLQDAMTCEGLKFPLIAKSLIAEGDVDSHRMFLVLNHDGLIKLNPPILLQEFVNHGGVMFKVYVAGDHVKCTKRKSLADISEERLDNPENLISFSEVSRYIVEDENFINLTEATEMPPMSFINEVTNQVRRALKLHLFNFDMIRDNRVDENRYLIVDINYFPGYAKVPHYETMITDFFLDIAHNKRNMMS